VPGFLSGLFESKAATRNGSPKASEAINRATGSSPAGYYSGVGLGPAGPWDIEKGVKDGLERVTWVFRCVDVIAQKQSVLPIKVRKGYDRQNGSEVEDDRLFRLLNFRANPYEMSQQFRYRLSAIALLSRRGAFIEVVNGRDGRPSELHLLPPGVTSPVPDPKRFVAGYEVRRTDGVIEYLEPDRVIWVKLKPHPTDPYSQLTPLMAAGMAADTDFFAHLFNRNFLANDGRPGMLITVKGHLNDYDAREIKNRFSGGPAAAGRTSVIEADDVQVVDTSASPRDVQWSDLLRVSKEEILLAFGVPESIMGNASGRTFDNADAERENFYVDTEVPHCDALAASLDPLTGDLGDDTVLAFDYSSVDVLQRQAVRKREELRAEFAAGLRTLDDYLEADGKEPLQVAASRAYFQTNGLAITKSDEDQKKIEEMKVIGAPPPMEGGFPGAPGADPFGAPPAIDAGPAQVEVVESPVMNRAMELAAKLLQDQRPSFRRGVVMPRRVEHKEHRVAARVLPEDDSEDPDRGHTEGVIEGLLTGWDQRQGEVIPDRLGHVKSRRGTRHWDGEVQGEVKALDPSYGVETERWVLEMEQAIRNVLFRTVRREANKAAREMVDLGILDRIEREYLQPVGGRPLERIFGGKDHLNSALQRVLNDNLRIMSNATRNQMRRIEKRLRDMEADGRTMRQMQMEVRRMLGQRAQWRRTLAVNVTTASVEGAKNAVYQQGSRFMTKRWHAHDDERTRPSHKAADGQEVRGDQSFRVGIGFLRFPCDPTGPLQEIVQCRCWTTWHPTPDLVWTPNIPTTL
jgi:HK97 family phage portal protein